MIHLHFLKSRFDNVVKQVVLFIPPWFVRVAFLWYVYAFLSTSKWAIYTLQGYPSNSYERDLDMIYLEELTLTAGSALFGEICMHT